MNFVLIYNMNNKEKQSEVESSFLPEGGVSVKFCKNPRSLETYSKLYSLNAVPNMAGKFFSEHAKGNLPPKHFDKKAILMLGMPKDSIVTKVESPEHITFEFRPPMMKS